MKNILLMMDQTSKETTSNTRMTIRQFGYLYKRIKSFLLSVSIILTQIIFSGLISKQTVAWMDENVKFVPKEINPPNVSQARSIENF